MFLTLCMQKIYQRELLYLRYHMHAINYTVIVFKIFLSVPEYGAVKQKLRHTNR